MTDRSAALFSDRQLQVIGEQGEQVVREFFASLMPGVQLEDVRSVPEWQHQDVDYRARTTHGATLNIEVKSDRHIAQTQNVLFELMRIHHAADPKRCAYLGWSVFSAADRLVVFCPPSYQIFLFQTEKLRRGMQAYTREKRADMNLKIVTSDESRTTINVLVPLRYVPHQVFRLSFGRWLSERNPEGMH